MQKPAVQAARDLGCRITLVDTESHVLCRPLCDSFKQINLTDTEKIVDFARSLYDKQGLDAVFTAGTDFSYAVSRAAEECSFPAHSSFAAKNASDKLLMRACFERAGVPSPLFAEADAETASFDKKILEVFLRNYSLAFPLVVKPCDNMGARGCRLVHSISELSSALKEAIFFSETGRAIVEEYMDGPEFSIDALIYNGELTITGFADRHIFFPPYFIEMGHTMPSSINEAVYRDLLEVFADGIHALGLSYGAAKADIKLTSKGPMIGEIAARLSGGYMSGWTYPYASDFNLIREALILALGGSPETLVQNRIKTNIHDSAFEIFEIPCKRFCAERAWLSIPGTVRETFFFDKARCCEGVKDVFPRICENEHAVFPVNNVEKAGNVIAVGSDFTQASNYAAEAVKTVFLRLKPDNAATKDFLEQALDTSFPPSAFQLPPKTIDRLEKQVKDTQYADGEEITLLHCLKKHADLLDWNGRSLSETVCMYNELRAAGLINGAKSGAGVYGKKFWHYLIRGGLQGAVFYSDNE